jgi:hypothetical protein
MKKCSKCKQVLEDSSFKKNASKPDGLSTECKPCVSEYNRRYRENKILEFGDATEYYKHSKRNHIGRKPNFEKYGGKDEYYKQFYIKYQKGKTEKSAKAWREKNKQHISEKNKEYRNRNKERCSLLYKNWAKKKRRGVRRFGFEMSNSEYLRAIFKENPEIKLRYLARVHLYRYIKGRFDSYEFVVGCSTSYFKQYVESLFLDGMSWDNHGEWHFDHIVPLSSAKTEAELLSLNKYTNIQPLWAKDNLAKGKRIL